MREEKLGASNRKVEQRVVSESILCYLSPLNMKEREAERKSI